MNRKISLVIALTGVFLLFGSLFAEDAAPNKPQEKKIQTDCPVLGGKINKSLYVDFEGKRIYVCCDDCIAKVKADPEKYIKKLEAQGIVLDATPKDKSSPEGKAGTTGKKEGDHTGHQH